MTTNETLPRRQITGWLTAHQIPWEPCGNMVEKHCVPAYAGPIYLDIPYDESEPVDQAVSRCLENPDGSLRWPAVMFQYLKIEVALRYAHHDDRTTGTMRSDGA